MMDADGAAMAEAREGAVVCIARSGAVAPGLGASQNRGFSDDCIRTGEALFCEDADSDAWVDRDACRQIGVRSLVLVPVIDQSKVIGILGVFSAQRTHFARFDVAAMRWAASVFARLLHSADRESVESSAECPELAARECPAPEPPAEVPSPPPLETPVLRPQLVPPAIHAPAARRSRVLPSVVLVILLVLVGAYLRFRTGPSTGEPGAATNLDITVAVPKPAADVAVAAPAEKVAATPAIPARKEPPGFQGINLVRRIVHSSDSFRTAITIETDAPVAYRVNSATNPDRVYVDLQEAHLAPGHLLRVPEVEDGRLQRIRAAQFDAKVVRVVLDLPKPASYSISRDVNPHRLIVELRTLDGGAGHASVPKK